MLTCHAVRAYEELPSTYYSKFRMVCPAALLRSRCEYRSHAAHAVGSAAQKSRRLVVSGLVQMPLVLVARLDPDPMIFDFAASLRTGLGCY